MALKLKPIVIPNARIEPLRVGDYPFHLTDQERFLFDIWAQESAFQWGTIIELFSLNLAASKRDALYDEPTKRVYTKPFKVNAWVSMPVQNPVVGEEGFRIHFDATSWIARKELEDAGASSPKEGDIVHFWKSRQFDVDAAAETPNIPNSGYYFDVLNSTPTEHMFDTSTFVGFKLTLKRRSEFGAERKIVPP